MDFMNRGNRPVQQNTPTAPDTNLGSAPKPASKPSKGNRSDKLVKIGYIGFLIAIVVLIVAMLFSLVFNQGKDSKESGYVNKDQYQAVFLNGGQVYFGKVTDLNSKYINLNDIYYLRVNQQVQPDQQQNTNANDISLVKLGCELHGPEDSMVINREQVIFWENLKADGQVAKAVEEFVKANPNGQQCQQQTTENNQSQSNTPAANNNANTNTNNNNATTNNNSTNQNR